MRDFRDAKPMAQTIRATLAAKGLKISVGESLELIARAFGAADWNTLSAAIKAAEAPSEGEPAPPSDDKQALDRLAKTLGLEGWDELAAAVSAARPAPAARDVARAPSALSPPGRGGTYFSEGLQATLHRAIAEAATRRHQYTTLEHLLLALIDDADASGVMEACQIDHAALRAALTRHLDHDLTALVDKGEPGEHPPTAGFHRAIQRAVIHVQSAGRGTVTGANVLVAIFSERESHAAHFLGQQGMNRYDAVNFIAHGIRPLRPG